MIDAEKSDLYDVLAYIAFAAPTISRHERVTLRKPIIHDRYDEKQREFLDFVLDHYVTEGVGELDEGKLPRLLELKYYAVSDAVKELGGVTNVREVFIGFQEHLYSPQQAA